MAYKKITSIRVCPFTWGYDILYEDLVSYSISSEFSFQHDIYCPGQFVNTSVSFTGFVRNTGSGQKLVSADTIRAGFDEYVVKEKSSYFKLTYEDGTYEFVYFYLDDFSMRTDGASTLSGHFTRPSFWEKKIPTNVVLIDDYTLKNVISYALSIGGFKSAKTDLSIINDDTSSDVGTYSAPINILLYRPSTYEATLVSEYLSQLSSYAGVYYYVDNTGVCVASIPTISDISVSDEVNEPTLNEDGTYTLPMILEDMSPPSIVAYAPIKYQIYYWYYASNTSSWYEYYKTYYTQQNKNDSTGILYNANTATVNNFQNAWIYESATPRIAYNLANCWYGGITNIDGIPSSSGTIETWNGKFYRPISFRTVPTVGLKAGDIIKVRYNGKDYYTIASSVTTSLNGTTVTSVGKNGVEITF